MFLSTPKKCNKNLNSWAFGVWNWSTTNLTRQPVNALNKSHWRPFTMDLILSTYDTSNWKNGKKYWHRFSWKFWQTRPILRCSIRRSNTSMTGHLLWKNKKFIQNNPLFGWTGFKHASVALTILVVRCNSYAHQIRGSLLIWIQHKRLLRTLKKFDNMYWIAWTMQTIK